MDCDGVRGGLLSLQMLIVMALYGSVRRLVLVLSVRCDKHGGHHCQRTERAGTILLTHRRHSSCTPRYSRPPTSHTRHRVIDQCVEICDAGTFELLRILAVKNLLENILEGVVVFFGDGILGGKPQILLCVKCIVKAASRKALDGIAEIVLSLHHARTGKIVVQFSCLGSVLRRVDQFAFARSRIFISLAL